MEFHTAEPHGPLERESINLDPIKPTANIEEPIIPIGELGVTFPEHDQAGRFKNMLQFAQAQLRAGVGKLQLALQTPPESAIGGRPKAYGKEFREKMREIFLANEAQFVGAEMPTSMNNLSGFNQQQNVFDEETRMRHLDEVRDAIKFVADVGQGGGVDIVSWEYPRQVFNAPWNKPDKQGKQIFEEAGERIVQIVDDRNGRVQAFRVSQIESLPLPRDPKTGAELVFDPLKDAFVNQETGKEVKDLPTWQWADFEKHAKKTGVKPEVYFYREQLELQRKQAAGWFGEHKKRARMSLQEMQRNDAEIQQIKKATAEEFQQFLQHAGLPPNVTKQQAIAPLEKAKEQTAALYNHELESISSYKQQMTELDRQKQSIKPIDDYAKSRSVQSYAEAGVMAMQETHANKYAKKPVHVGPELGWPHAYGSHPSEFKELILNARKRMGKLLTSKWKIGFDGKPLEGEKNPYYDPKLSESQAQKEATRHIKGVFDTSHFGMWLKHYKPHLPWEKRVKEFNKWYMDEVKEIAKTDIVGGIQLVDSQSSAHGHLPPGEGIFPVKEAAIEFKKNDFTGFMVSEGHEEERINEGRIMVQTWKHFNAPISSSYGPGAPQPQRFGDVYQQYFKNWYSPQKMFGSYTPPFGEYKPWSEIPFE